MNARILLLVIKIMSMCALFAHDHQTLNLYSSQDISAETMQTTNPPAQECITEITGVGKVALEEGSAVAHAVIDAVKNNPALIKQELEHLVGKLKLIGNNIWESIAGLIYGPGSKQGHRIKHVLEHAKADPSKPIHSVYNVSNNEILSLIDEAWLMRNSVTSVVQANRNEVYTIPM